MAPEAVAETVLAAIKEGAEETSEGDSTEPSEAKDSSDDGGNN